MKEFIEKLIGRLKEKSVEITFPLYPDDSTSFVPITEAITIVNQLAEEYNNDFCEWKLDGVYLNCQHDTELFISCLEDEKYRYNHCPICGKKIKVVEPKGE